MSPLTFPDEMTLSIERTVDIKAPAQTVFKVLLESISTENRMPDGTPFPFKLEPWPGGRWFRDLGNNTGHLWGNVQVIKPPTLLEITGPLCMSYPAMNHVQYRLTENAAGTRLAFKHRAIGDIARDHREGMPEGWGHMLDAIRDIAEKQAKH